jgi:ribosomal-protein-alanine N-acetyltransferase
MGNASTTDMSEAGLTLETPNLVLRLLPRDGAERMLAYYVRNQEHLSPWEVARPPAFFTREFWEQRSVAVHDEASRGVGFRWVLLRKGEPEGPFLGTCSLSQIVRGPNQSALLGFGIDHSYVGRGLMGEAVRAVMSYAFGELGLKRVHANYMPTNEPSGKLLGRLGLVIEGYAREYVFINGAWRDHILTSAINPDPAKVRSPAAPMGGR